MHNRRHCVAGPAGQALLGKVAELPNQARRCGPRRAHAVLAGESASMAKRTPLVRGDTLVYQLDDHEQALSVGTAAWYAWLTTASTFAFTSAGGSFTARKERASNQLRSSSGGHTLLC